LTLKFLNHFYFCIIMIWILKQYCVESSICKSEIHPILIAPTMDCFWVIPLNLDRFFYLTGMIYQGNYPVIETDLICNLLAEKNIKKKYFKVQRLESYVHRKKLLISKRRCKSASHRPTTIAINTSHKTYFIYQWEKYTRKRL
jgi:hypothetical protein